MARGYFNYDLYHGSGFWGRRAFLRHWWGFYRRDPRWVPPYYPAMQQVLLGSDPHLARLTPSWLRLEAMPVPRESPHTGTGAFPSADSWYRTVAAAGLLHDRRRRDASHALALPRFANDGETLNRFLEAAAKESGARSIVGPTHLSPYLGTGALSSHWHLLPALHTPYNPPYLPSVLQAVMEEGGRSRLHELSVPTGENLTGTTGQAILVPLNPAELADKHLPLLLAACAPWEEFPPPDAAEATFLLRWLGRWPLYGLLALAGEEPVGFVLLQPDLAARLRRAGGGRNPLWRIWLRWVARRPVRRGRLLFGAVLSRWRGRGIGHQLMEAALAYGRRQGWRTITVGPIPETAQAGRFLGQWHAAPRQEYRLYRWEPSPASFFF